ncbi:uncharacterized protein Z518_01150 [Rhinocladiella mackenziei CBS 650.93]|uniref:FAD-binding PCMH-type domain-containing protein n=1 Tax=Rhinocladiella mackenziei CBS 650.93 TaxID=1442369 RepID=A0A0D2IVL2_9EURO|nr:uncharacterized protein Z518_01150 [Rhinocladiella mackenziei CBS 650.93]KIX10069.1 hypothetical protein Z518_01150 [Rhinocladiella mackenziei CBS 650.93]
MALNESISGRLKATIPAGMVCHPEQPVFDNVSCRTVQEQWTNSSWHANDPSSSAYNDDACLPNVSAPCSTNGYPAYVIEATNRLDVQRGVDFAKSTGVRLIVKGTGHDFLGRSSGPGSLSIWTHGIRGVKVNMHDFRARRYGGDASVKIAAGMRWFEIYNEAAKYNLTIVGGSDMNVGIGGWILGGGHGSVSSRYGLGADQILEMEVITAGGQYHIINERCENDLFWAMRGGGGSTFAILLSVTMKAYPSISGTEYAFDFNTTADSDTFWSLAPYFHSQIPSLSESGAMGEYMLTANGTPSGYADQLPGGLSASAAVGRLVGKLRFPGQTREQVKGIMGPVEAAIRTSDWSVDNVLTSGSVSRISDFTTSILGGNVQAVGIDGRLGSWLLDEPALKGNFKMLKRALRTSSPQPFPMLGYLVAGPGVRKAQIPGGGNAVNPAWRRAYAHVVLVRVWPALNDTAKGVLVRSLREEAVPALKEIAPASGAYLNEADPTNSDWQKDFYGENYPRLLDIKKKWDPEGVFWCKPCVGHDLWEVKKENDDSDPVEWGIGQGPVPYGL